MQLGGHSGSCQSEPLKAHLGKSAALGPLGWEYTLTDRACSHQSPEISRVTLAHWTSPTEQEGRNGCMHMDVTFLLRLELLPSSPGSWITALKKGTLRIVFRSLGQEIRRMWEKRASFQDEERARCGVLASFSLKPEVS